jgi:hypothetical protein
MFKDVHLPRALLDSYINNAKAGEQSVFYLKTCIHGQVDDFILPMSPAMGMVSSRVYILILERKRQALR